MCLRDDVGQRVGGRAGRRLARVTAVGERRVAVFVVSRRLPGLGALDADRGLPTQCSS